MILRTSRQCFGSDYTETYMDIAGHFGESYYVREYNDGLSVIISRTLTKLAEIELFQINTKPGWVTRLVTQPTIYCQNTANYIPNLKPFTAMESLKAGLMWVMVWLIFDFNKDDNMIINVDISLDSKVELIKLTKMMYLD